VFSVLFCFAPRRTSPSRIRTHSAPRLVASTSGTATDPVPLGDLNEALLVGDRIRHDGRVPGVGAAELHDRDAAGGLNVDQSDGAEAGSESVFSWILLDGCMETFFPYDTPDDGIFGSGGNPGSRGARRGRRGACRGRRGRACRGTCRDPGLTGSTRPWRFPAQGRSRRRAS